VVRAGYSLSNYLEGTGTNLRLPINPPFAVEHDDNYTSRQLQQSAARLDPRSMASCHFWPMPGNQLPALPCAFGIPTSGRRFPISGT
jgi:hypothetical protein